MKAFLWYRTCKNTVIRQYFWPRVIDFCKLHQRNHFHTKLKELLKHPQKCKFSAEVNTKHGDLARIVLKITKAGVGHFALVKRRRNPRCDEWLFGTHKRNYVQCIRRRFPPVAPTTFPSRGRCLGTVPQPGALSAKRTRQGRGSGRCRRTQVRCPRSTVA